MKKLLILILFPFLLGCSDDDGDDDSGKGGNNPPPAYFNPVEGNWVYTRNKNIITSYSNKFIRRNYEYYKGNWDLLHSDSYTINETTITINGFEMEYNISISGNDTILTLIGTTTDRLIKVTREYKPE